MAVLLAASFFFAVMGLWVKLLGAHVPAAEVTFFRCLLPAVCLLPLLRGERLAQLRRHFPILILRGLLGGVAILLYFKAIARIPYADASLLSNTAPLFSAMFAALFLGEAPPRRLYAALPVTLLGVAMIARPQGGGDLMGHAMGLLSGVVSGSAHTTVRKATQDCGTVLVVAVFSWVVVLMMVPFSGAGWPVPNGRQALLMLGIGATALVAQLLMTLAIQGQRVARAGTVLLSSVPMAVLLGVVFLHETPDLWQMLGMALVLGGVGWLTAERDEPA
ncbi:MAG: DMT family transporter [Candidatus Xenobia bacterium]